MNWTRVYSSDLKRAVHTTSLLLSCSTVTEYQEEHILRSEWLREINFGVREGLSRDYNSETAKVEYARRNNLSVEDVIDTAETLDSVRTRQYNFVLQLLHDHAKEASDGSNGNDEVLSMPSSSAAESINTHDYKVLCVSHGGYIKQFLKNFCVLPATEKIANCSVSIVTIEWADVTKPHEFTCTTTPDRVNISHEQVDYNFHV